MFDEELRTTAIGRLGVERMIRTAIDDDLLSRELAAKLRVLARPDRDGTELQATDPLLIRVQGVPVVVLRTDE